MNTFEIFLIIWIAGIPVWFYMLAKITKYDSGDILFFSIIWHTSVPVILFLKLWNIIPFNKGVEKFTQFLDKLVEKIRKK